MRCSRCSEVVKPIVAIDIDGTLGDYHGHFLRYACQYLGYDMEKLLEMSLNMYDGSEPFSYYCCRELSITIGEYRTIKLAYRQGAMKRSMPINDGATTLCRSVPVSGGELWLTTTRPYLSLDGVISDTTFWLQHHGIEFDGLLFDDDKYKVLAERVDPGRVVAVLDDVDEMYDSAAALYGDKVVMLYRNNYNAKMEEGRNVVYSLSAATNRIITRIHNWEALRV